MLAFQFALVLLINEVYVMMSCSGLTQKITRHYFFVITIKIKIHYVAFNQLIVVNIYFTGSKTSFPKNINTDYNGAPFLLSDGHVIIVVLYRDKIKLYTFRINIKTLRLE